MSRIRITYREYTTDGRFVMANTMLTDEIEGPQLIREMFSANDSLTLADYYRDRGFLASTERLKPLFLTNVMVHGEDGKLMPFAHLI